MAERKTPDLIQAVSEIIAGSRHMTAVLAYDLCTELREAALMRDRIQKLSQSPETAHPPADRISRLIACGRASAQRTADETDAQIINGLCDELDRHRVDALLGALSRVRAGVHRRIAVLEPRQ